MRERDYEPTGVVAVNQKNFHARLYYWHPLREREYKSSVSDSNVSTREGSAPI
ncbi:hypothetical protein C8Q74DRAFT_1309884 [Fomes fomentarius]|nr:hypothetical protein C8Q74DRAFT_1309884 [Fomes fomentarius]